VRDRNRMKISMLLAAAGAVLAGALVAPPTSAGQAPPTVLTKTPEFSASAIIIERTEPPKDLAIPEDFRVATYENVINEVTKTGRFKQVFRSGDLRANDVPDLVTMRLLPVTFTKGSETARGTTTVKGWSELKIKVVITDRSGKTLVDQEVQGNVRFYGENIEVTKDFAKKAAMVVYQNFRAPGH